RITPERTARAAALVRTGETIGCARPLNTVADVENARPAVHLMLRAGDVADPAVMSSTSDYVALAPHGFAHSHLDALCHFVWRGQIYNGRPADTVLSTGATANAVTIGEHGIVTRGVLPGEPRQPIHVLCLVAMGLQLLDNLDLARLAASCAERGRWEFLFAVAPLRIAGGTASPVNPIAVF